MSSRAARAYIGISGWRYPPWRGVFYPKGLRQADELSFASRELASVEVNGSFYSLLRPETYQAWYDETPPEFVFSVKGGRYITHLKRLKEVDVALANFFASGVLRLREKLGPILWQLPPQLAFDASRLERFFALLPRTTGEAAALAQGHDQRLSGRSETRALVDAPLRHALEVRHPSFVRPELIALLRRYGIAACVADTAGLYPVIEDVTADFVYVRLHGDKELYASGYSPRALQRWAGKVNDWRAGEATSSKHGLSHLAPSVQPRDVFVYFDNDLKVRAPFDALNLQRLVEGQRAKRLPPVLATVKPTLIGNDGPWRGVGRSRTQAR